ncbi:MAG TPA: BON domain-containing protein [Candidatus Eisenbacteria bacterium]|nr:BON domain-containing protein [Candidatus Eisenbacteria bacterium]
MQLDKRDVTTKAAVLRELRYDTGVNETEIGVSVADGVVTLTGRVDNEAQRAAAQEAAHRADGVLDVANEIMVKIPFALGRTDADLALAVRESLEREPDVPAEQIHSTVYDAVVTLTGMVDTRHAMEVAERAAHRVACVRRVANKLVVRRGTIDLAALRRSIEGALERRAQREAGHIELSAEDGVVTLEGRVNSFSDKSVVLDLVRHAPAVRSIEDRLRIEP